jgi:glycosyltransferase involved in cell wall biosynthesis
VRILMVAACPLPWPRGTPIRIHRMAEALTAHGHEVTVATYPLGDAVTATPYRLMRVRAGSPMAADPGPTLKKLLYLDPLLFGALARALRRERFDVIHAHHYEGLGTALAARAAVRSRVPLVYDAHTLLASELPQYRMAVPRRLLALIGTAMDRRLPGRADHLVVVSERMVDWFTAAGIPVERISLIANGVEHDHFNVPGEAAPVPGAARETGLRRIVFAGNLAEYQGISLLIEAFARLRQVRRDVELVFVTGSDLAPLRPELDRLGLGGAVVRLHDDYALLPARLAAGDVLVNPRIDCDGLPQKLLNYMAAGRPVVSFAGSAALLRHERTGLVVADGDTDAFANAVLRLLDDTDLGHRLGAEARRTVVAAYGWRQVAERVTAVYDSLLGGAA